VEELFGVPAARQDVVIVCAGPNAVYYHTEGNPPGLGQNDNGDVQPGGKSQFTITAAIVYAPEVFLDAPHGETIAAVFLGEIRLYGSVGTDLLGVVEDIKKRFS